ncbi:MAG: ABC transporter permease [Rhabdochlamydiaceae bacterium]
MGLHRKFSQRYRYSILLLRQLVKTDFKLRYQGSVLGYVWSLLRPLLLFLILYMVFTVFLPVGKGVPHYPVYLLLGIILWNFFVEITSGSVSAIVGKGDLMRKINFPKYNIILAVSFSALINLALNFVVIGIFMVVGRVGLSWHVVLILPLLVELYLISLALAFLLSALFVKFRDVSYIWEVAVQAGFYATPIIYPLSRIPYHRIRELLLLNPIAQIIQDVRYLLVTPSATTIAQEYGGDKLIWAIPIAITLLLVFSGSWYFKSRSKYFAEEV